MAMLWKNGLTAVFLLLLSRLSGLARESALAAAFGVGPLADAVVLMLTLPDLLVGVALSGAMSYVLLPHWAKLPVNESAHHQSQVGWLFAGLGLLVAGVLWVWAALWASGFAPGLAQAHPELATTGMAGAALALPWAFMAAVLGARLQYRIDMVGLYAANLVVNGVLVAALCWFVLSRQTPMPSVDTLRLMAGFLLLSMLARLVWQVHRLGIQIPAKFCFKKITPYSFFKRSKSIFFYEFFTVKSSLFNWVAAVVVAGIPLVIYLIARSLAAREGMGALSVFNYAWKLVELPQLLVIQVLAVLALPAFSRAVMHSETAWIQVFRRAFSLAWVLACAAMVALWWGAALLAQVLFGWGRMDAAALAKVTEWGTWGALCLLPCAAVSMWLALLASLGQLRRVAQAWMGVACVATLAGNAWVHTGPAAMVWLNAVWMVLAVCVLWQHQSLLRRSVPWTELAPPTGVAMLTGGLANYLLPLPWWQALLAGVACVVCLLLVAWRTSISFRQSIRPDAADSLPSAHRD